MTKPYTWIVRFDVAPEWVADGFSMSDERALTMLGRTLDCACMSTELAARVLAVPSALRIVREQGYSKSDPRSVGEVRKLLGDSPHAYGKVGDAVTLDKALADAINLLDSVAFVRDENDNTGAILSQLRDVLSMIRGDEPISDIEWQPAST